MLVRTQDKLSVISFEKMCCVSIKEIKNRVYIVGLYNNEQYILGEYSSISVAKRVLDNILRDYKEIYFDSENEYWYIVYEMPDYQ